MSATLEITKFHENFTTSKERDGFMFDKEFMSDCVFVIQDGDKTIKIPCHKYILGSCSWEFYNLFYSMKADSIYIPIANFSCDVVKKFLEFIYKETTELDMKTVWDILKLAKKFGVKKLIDFCSCFLSKNVREENLIQIIQKSTEFELQEELLINCIKVIGRLKLDFFTAAFFFQLSRNGLNNILKSDYLDVEEIDLFRFVDNWAENICTQNKKLINGRNKRLALGDIVNNIRFGTMSINQFAKCTKNECFLTAQQIVDIFNSITSHGEYKCKFSSIRRLPTINHISFTSRENTISLAHVNPTGVFKFSVNEEKLILGFGYYGTTRISTKKLFLQLKYIESNVIIHQSTVKNIEFDGTSEINQFLFKKPIVLEKCKEYAFVLRWSCVERFYCLRNAKKIYTDNSGGKIFINGPCHNFASLIIQ